MRTRYLGLPGLATLLLTGCASGPSASDVAEAAVDVHSHSRPDEVLVTHVALDLRLDFENKQVHGLVATEDGKAMALEMYAKFRPLYHSISTRGLDQLLGWSR